MLPLRSILAAGSLSCCLLEAGLIAVANTTEPRSFEGFRVEGLETRPADHVSWGVSGVTLLALGV